MKPQVKRTREAFGSVDIRTIVHYSSFFFLSTRTLIVPVVAPVGTVVVMLVVVLAVTIAATPLNMTILLA